MGEVEIRPRWDGGDAQEIEQALGRGVEIGVDGVENGVD
jgi:hypothetical protein